MSVRWMNVSLALLIALIFTGPTLGEVRTDLEPEAMERLEAVPAYLDAAEQLQVRVETRTRIQVLDAEHDAAATLELAINHPHQLAIHREEREQHEQPEQAQAHRQVVVVDGDFHHEYISTTARYTRNPAPPGVRTLFEHDPIATEGEPTIVAQLRPFVQPLLSPQGLRYFKEHFLVEAAYRGETELDGRPHHHIRLLLGDKYHPHDHLHWELPVEVWIAIGDEPLPTRLRLDLVPMIGQQMMHEPTEAYVDVRFDDWRIDQPFEDEALFSFTPPEDAELVDTIYELQAGGGGFDELLGEPAPTFELELLEGGMMDLATHVEREEVVILDFWATWCGPCIQAMPHLLAIQDRFADQDVVLYAINQVEPAEHVRAFVQEKGWDLRIPMDTDGRVSRQYAVRGIPHTVLIGRDGTVQSVHVGFTPNMQQQLGSEIEQLLEGEALVE